MTAAADFLRAIQAAPDDDAPRLVYADWLEEHGEPERALFIRVQCELARMEKWASEQFLVLPESREGQYLDALRERARALLDAHGLDWLADLAVEFSTPLRPDIFRRGFVESLILSAADWLAHGDAIYAREPVREVRQTDEPDWPAWDTDIRMTHHGTRQGGRREATCGRWPGVTFRLPEPHGARLQRNVGTYENPVWEDAEVVGRVVTVPRADLTASFDDLARQFDQARQAVAEFAEQARETESSPAPTPRRRPGHSRMPGWLAEQRARPRRR
jgi:uncharacterized protein (TIGR02996 family)